MQNGHGVPQREPIFNVPTTILLLGAAMVAVHAIRGMLSREAGIDVILRFAFIPAQAEALFGGGPHQEVDLPGGVWTFVTYAFLHGDWVHLAVNGLWFLAFGPAILWRFGPTRFLVFSMIAAIAGALAHYSNHVGEFIPMVGASAVIAAYMAASLRFAFQDGAPLGRGARRDPSAYRQPANSLSEAFNNRTVLVFIAVYLAMNLFFGAGSANVGGLGGSIAWEAHLGGFAAGLFLFPLFDPYGGRRPPENWNED